VSETKRPKPTLSQLDQIIAALEAMPADQRAYVQDSLASLRTQRDEVKNQLNVNDLTADKVVVGTYIEFNPPPPPPPDPALAAERAYLKALRTRLRRVPLADAMDIANAITLDQIYVSLDVETPDLEGGTARKSRDGEKPLSALEAVTRNPRCVILGQPGSGKTSFVNQLADRLVAGRLGEPVDALPRFEGLLPVVMNLRDLAPHLPNFNGSTVTPAIRRQLLDAVWAQWTEDLPITAKGFAERLAEILDAGQAILVFDGLDEVPEDVRLRVRLAVGIVLNEYKKIARVLVTCRSRSYSGDAVLPDMIAHTVANFDKEKIRAFVKRWYQIQVPSRMALVDAEVRVADLTQAALGKDLVDMAANPLLLTTMALVHQRDTKLPRQRVRLYDEAIKVLIQRWQDLKGIGVAGSLRQLLADDLRLRRVIERLAFESHQIQSKNLNERLTRGRAIEILEDSAYLGNPGLAGDFLDYVDQRSGLFMGLGGGAQAGRPHAYDFPHRTFQEHLAGCFMLDGRPRDRARLYREKASEGDYWSLAGLYGTETLVFSRNSVKDALDLAYALCPHQAPASTADWRAIAWAGQISAMIGKDEILMDDEPDGGRKFLERLTACLTKALRVNELRPIERAEAGRALGTLGDPRKEVTGVDKIPFCQVPAGWFWMGSPDDDDRAFPDEMPMHPQRIARKFEVSKFPITQGQFDEFVHASDGYMDDQWWTTAGLRWRRNRFENARYEFPFTLPNHPVVGVTYFEAVAFCSWLTIRMQVQGHLSANQVVRLPSEAEWEAAARGDLKSSEHELATERVNPRRYPFGDDIQRQHANFLGTGIMTTSAVGCFPLGVSAQLCEEMSGNAWEWTSTIWRDNYDNYVPDETSASAASRVIRGGSYINGAKEARCAYRNKYNPANHDQYVSFRVVLGTKLPSA